MEELTKGNATGPRKETPRGADRFVALERADKRCGYVLAVDEKRERKRFLPFLNVACGQGVHGEQWQSGPCCCEYMCMHGQVLVGGSHMHGQHATTESTLVHNVLW
jgi:hypothetical protein